MNVKKLLACLIGIVFTLVSIIGVLLLIPVVSVSNTIAIVIICLSLAIGLLIHDFTSILGLLCGILILTIPAWIIGVLFIIIGIAGCICNAVVAKNDLHH